MAVTKDEMLRVMFSISWHILSLFSINVDILSDKEELDNWRHSSSVVCDLFSVHNALYTRACIIGRRRQWPLLIDPDNQALSWIVQLQEKGLASFHEIVYEEEEEGKIDTQWWNEGWRPQLACTPPPFIFFKIVPPPPPGCSPKDMLTQQGFLACSAPLQ